MQNKVFKMDDEFGFLTEDLLRKEYSENKLTDRQIAQKYNIGSKATIWNRRKFFSIENNYKKKSNQNAKTNREFSISLDTAKLYLSQNLTYEEIAEKIGCSRMVAYRRIKELGLIEDQESTIKKLKWHEPISELQNKFLLGCLLGDGSITKRGMFQCSHSHKQLEYIKYKSQLLDNLMSPEFEIYNNTVKNHQNGKIYNTHSMRTMQNEFLEKMRECFYANGKKIFPYEFLMGSGFDEYSLAIWYMDDGSRNKSGCSINSQGFSYAENLKIIEFLYKKYNICGVIQEINSKTREINPNHKHYVRFNKDDSNKLFKLIRPHVLPYFQYKISK